MDIQRFKNDFESKRMHFIIDFCLEQKDWFSYESLYEDNIKKAIEHYSKKHKNTEGKPHQTKKNIKYLITIGFLIADPVKGLKVNKDFTPRNQKELLN